MVDSQIYRGFSNKVVAKLHIFPAWLLLSRTGPSGRGKPIVDLVPALLAAGGPLL